MITTGNIGTRETFEKIELLRLWINYYKCFSMMVKFVKCFKNKQLQLCFDQKFQSSTCVLHVSIKFNILYLAGIVHRILLYSNRIIMVVICWFTPFILKFTAMWNSQILFIPQCVQAKDWARVCKRMNESAPAYLCCNSAWQTMSIFVEPQGLSLFGALAIIECVCVCVRLYVCFCEWNAWMCEENRI